MGLLALAVVGAQAGCPADAERAGEDKVKRWAAEVMPSPVPAAAAPVEEDVVAPAPAPAVPAPPTPPRDACVRLMDVACGALGPHSEECHEARAVLPAERTPEWRDGCQHILDEYVTEPAPEWAERRRNACRRLERRVCADVGADTWKCRQARADASRLRWERPEACLGDVLAWEARRLFSSQPTR